MTQLAERLAAGQFVVTTELNPPKGTVLTRLFDGAAKLRACVDAFNVTDSHNARMSLSPLAAAHLLLDRGVEPIVQFTTRDRNRIALQSDMLGAAALGIRNLVCMGGDPPHLGDHPDAKPVFDLATVELIAVAAALNQGIDAAGNSLDQRTAFHIGAVVNPGAADLDLEIARFEEKVAAGATFFQTQAIYDPERFLAFAERVAPFGVQLLAGILPIKSVRMARYMNANVPGIEIPERLIEEIGNSDDVKAASRRQAAKVIRRIRDACAGVHLMALGWEDQIPAILEEANVGR